MQKVDEKQHKLPFAWFLYLQLRHSVPFRSMPGVGGCVAEHDATGEVWGCFPAGNILRAMRSWFLQEDG